MHRQCVKHSILIKSEGFSNPHFGEPFEACRGTGQHRVPAAPEGNQQPVYPQGGKNRHNQDRARAGVGSRLVQDFDRLQRGQIVY